jgi:FkbM family methyltransferase
MNDTTAGEPQGVVEPAISLEAKVEEFCAQAGRNRKEDEEAFQIAYRRQFRTVYQIGGNAGRQRLLNTIAKNIKTSQRVEEFVEKLFGRLSPAELARFLPLVHRGAKLRYEAADVRLDVGSVLEGRETLSFPERFPDVVAWIEGLPEGTVLYDVQAGNGVRSVLAAALRELRVVAFEPGYENFAALCENVRLNGLSDRVTPIHGAVAATSGLGTYHYRTLERGADQNRLAQPVDRRGNRFRPVASMTSVCWSIDDAVSRLALPAPTHLCLAIDGGELDVLAGARDTLAGAGLTNLLLIGDGEAATRVRGWFHDTPWTEVPASAPGEPLAVQALQFVRDTAGVGVRTRAGTAPPELQS